MLSPFIRRRRFPSFPVVSPLPSVFIHRAGLTGAFFFPNAIYRLIRSAKFGSDTVAAYGLAVIVVASDAALALVQLSLGLPAYACTLFIGLVVGIIIANLAGNYRHQVLAFLGTLKHSMATVLTIPVDKKEKEEEFPFPGGALYKL